MKKLFTAVAIALCTVAAACGPKEKEPENAELWVRAVEPQLTGPFTWQACRRTLRPGKVVDAAFCGPDTPTFPGAPVSTSSEECQPMLRSQTDANRVLSRYPHCTDAAIRVLERFAETEPSAKSDLAGAYYVRAQRFNTPVDLLRSYKAADEAIAANAKQPAAYFNQALTLEAMGLHTAAIASLDRFLSLDRSQWNVDALDRRKRLERNIHNTASSQWPLIRKELLNTARKGDRKTIDGWVRRYQAAAFSFFDDDVVPSWPRGAESRLISEAMTAATGDAYFVDVDRGVESAVRLREAFRAAANARTLEAYEAVARDAGRLRYPSVRARANYQRGNLLVERTRYLEALNAFSAALEDFIALRDPDHQAAIYARRCGVRRSLGQHEPAWRDALEAQRRIHHVAGNGNLLVIAVESAKTAKAFETPRAARGYRDALIAALRVNLLNAAEDLNVTEALTRFLAVAYRGRAEEYVGLGEFARAEKDLVEYRRLLRLSPTSNPEWRAMLQAQSLEVQAQAALASDPGNAVRLFTAAIASTPADVYRMHRTTLYVQRADANRRAGREDDATKDLEAALNDLDREESEILNRRKRGEAEEVWSTYFARFRETYEGLIRSYFARGKYAEAFKYAERARAFEPLKLILQGEHVPEAFNAIAGSNKPLEHGAVQKHLAPGTFLIEYLVLRDETLVWVMSRDRFEHLVLPVRQQDIDDWSQRLQAAAQNGDAQTFEELLLTPFERLVSQPLDAIEKMPGGTSSGRRIVVIPDRAIHGLPLVALRNPKNGHYLLEDATVEVAASATLYVISVLRDRELPFAQEPSALLIGNPRFDSGLVVAEGLGELLSAGREVQTIRRYYEPNVDVFTGAEATVPMFLEHAREHSVVHFAGHGVPNAQAPFQSMLLFAPSPDHNGVLTAQELITSLKLDKTRLVILAACSSAGGSPVGPEGLAPLVRPLITAGVPAVIGTLWNVRDQDATDVLVAFHGHYKLGKDAAAALRSAQLDLLKGGDHKVLAWAPFQVIGHASSPFGPATNPDQRRN